jgi:hypothetical protein
MVSFVSSYLDYTPHLRHLLLAKLKKIKLFRKLVQASGAQKTAQPKTT